MPRLDSHNPQVSARRGNAQFLVGPAHPGGESSVFLGKEPPDSAVEPVDLAGSRDEDRRQHDLRHPMRVTRRVDQSQGDTPRTTPQQPTIDTEVLAQQLEVGDQMGGGVVSHAGGRVGGVGCAAPAPALIEERDPVPTVRVLPRAHTFVAAPTGPAVQHHHGFAVRVSATLPIDPAPFTDLEQSARVRFGHPRTRCVVASEAVSAAMGVATSWAARSAVSTRACRTRLPSRSHSALFARFRTDAAAIQISPRK